MTLVVISGNDRDHPLSCGLLVVLHGHGRLREEGRGYLRCQSNTAHAFDLTGHNGFELYVRPLSEIAEEHQELAREKPNSYLRSEFPVADCPRISLSGDVATEIAWFARTRRFDLIVVPTHAGSFRRMLLGSTTAKVLNDATARC